MNNDNNVFFDQPYIDRQQVIFVDDVVFDAENKVSQQEIAQGDSSDGWSTLVLNTVYNLMRPTATDLIVEGVKYIIKTYQDARNKGLNIRMVPKKWISSFNLPPGHPRDAVLYVAHPAVKEIYVPAADFHRFTFEHKFSEALSLLMHLGAKEIRVEHLNGWKYEFSSRLSAGIPKASIELDESGINAHSPRSLLYEAELEGKNTPILPEELVWFFHEPTWQKVAEGRMKFGLKKFSLQLHYEDDFGVNAGLKVKAENVGLDLGGKFQNHESTTWSINGSF
ncbi:MAG: hypothetical protein AB7V04_05620 [Desulfomonilaceae bacterium]